MIVDDARRWFKLQAALRAAGRSFVVVGVREDPGWGEWSGEVEPDGANLALIAATNEFGSEDGHIPERSFLRSTLDEDEARIMRVASKAFGDVVDGTASAETALGRIGLFTVGRVQRKIRDLREPANAPETIARKGFDNPLIESGRLRQSIDFQVYPDGA